MSGVPGDERSRPCFGAVEGGGTKFVCAVGEGPDRILARTRVETTTPEETLDRVADFFARATAAGAGSGAAGRELAAVGVACFGPLELDPASPRFGDLLATPKPGWSGAPVAQALRRRLGVPVAVDTDVNGAALGEWRWGAARDCDPALYLTVGTGIGGGIVLDGRPLHGLLHPEMGHIPLPRLSWPDGRPDDFPGVCPFHGACFEGLVSGPALAARAGAPAAGSRSGAAPSSGASSTSTGAATSASSTAPPSAMSGVYGDSFPDSTCGATFAPRYAPAAIPASESAPPTNPRRRPLAAASPMTPSAIQSTVVIFSPY
jgi:predicted NBD/HSP70 family sugar kinase